uniref:Pectate lyase superfamily protein domain-containing protein n=1 Tax=Helicotheca tamesis TaxID=374047 RepID=A0A7S2HCT4_9STRA|mmetsp:Transcript_17083/g.23469  ORF Transcript_17083/g.23469 Transcript_17083/m.23469 type:complete len:673 (+) Transcript_17083:209-2227(+)|eukprot:CAMPEP_0185731054 /NCGR_PEP_ID=MMETSP1171-20130828/11738_1 /TAXON_ID=374046 /ORGANISM="Helicotheca tamensis, Strain CCMP826" /LENGTH=672 /DNA_ID=CAMNT_0028400231 /DNA_START=193 /DNA_END=2211 /DNA_ORIENTATION=-
MIPNLLPKNTTSNKIIDFSSIGGKAYDSSPQTELHNAKLLNQTLQTLLQPNSKLVIKGTFHLMGGIYASNLKDVVLQLDGSLIFSKNIKFWPKLGETEQHGRLHRRHMECIHFDHPKNVTLTSSKFVGGGGGGILDGQGEVWWGIPFLGYLHRAEDRPRLLRVSNGKDVLLEHWTFINSPYWTVYFDQVDGLEIRYVGISNRRTSSLDGNGHGVLDLSAFNTDGIDVSGRNVWIHDCNIWCQDDVICVKDGHNVSENMIFERINGTGVGGLTIGSIGGPYSLVRNITFRDWHLYKPMKGIYLKFRESDKAVIEDVLMENIIMQEPSQWPIWMGPAQQADSRNPCNANPCSLCWPYVPGMQCTGELNTTLQNILLRNVTIYQPARGGGVILGDDRFSIKDITFENVKVTHREINLSYDETFPMLPHKIHPDRYVFAYLPLILIGFTMATFVAVVISKRCYFRARHRNDIRRNDESNDSDDEQHSPPIKKVNVPRLVVSLEIVIIPIISWLVYINLSLSDPSSYYICNGVMNGITVGETFPTPSCFKDSTTTSFSRSRRTDHEYNSSYYMVPMTGVAIAVVTLVSIGALSIFVSRRVKQYRVDNPLFTIVPSDEEEVEDQHLEYHSDVGEEEKEIEKPNEKEVDEKSDEMNPYYRLMEDGQFPEQYRDDHDKEG